MSDFPISEESKQFVSDVLRREQLVYNIKAVKRDIEACHSTNCDVCKAFKKNLEELELELWAHDQG